MAAALLLLGGAAFVAVHRANARAIEPVRTDNAAGDAACLSCHQQKAGFEQTAHRLTSTTPTRHAILGSFTPGTNVVRTSNPSLYFHMDSTATGFYQTAVMGRPPDTTRRSERMAIVTGVRRGQSYLYWHRDSLFQLPISYWHELGWANSPGYPDGRPNFERPIPPRCLECHATWLESRNDPNATNRYQSDGALLGLTCEKCHGSGREHVSRERSILRTIFSPAILNPARLSRDRKVDGCALCHGGTALLRSTPFSYVPGEALQRRFDLVARPDTGTIDVHGNQVALLQRSRCYSASQMSCSTCHDVHQQQRDAAAISGRCLTCHTVQSCGLFPQHGQALVGRCVSCHMPEMTSQTVIANQLGQKQSIQMRTHWIKVYPQFQALESLPGPSHDR